MLIDRFRSSAIYSSIKKMPDHGLRYGDYKDLKYILLDQTWLFIRYDLHAAIYLNEHSSTNEFNAQLAKVPNNKLNKKII